MIPQEKKPWFMDRIAPGVWGGGLGSDASNAEGVTYRLPDLTEIAGVFCRCAEECRDAVRRLERLVEVRDDLPPAEAWSMVDKMWQRLGRVAPYRRKAFISLIATCRQRGTGKLLHALDGDGRAVAFALFVYDCNTAYYVLGAVDPDCGVAGVDTLLLWRGIRFLQGKTKVVDFGGPVGRSFGAVETSLATIPAQKNNGAIFYKARAQDTGNMWDTWGFFHEGTYYLYYLANSGETGWDNISVATSQDGVNWIERDPIIRRRPTSIWMGTGSTWKSPGFSNDGKFFMNFSASEGVMSQQTIFFAESTDLVTWKRLGDEYEFKGGGPWYEPTGRWDCIFTVPRPGGGLYGYWTAQPVNRTRRFGFGQSEDGIRWEALEAPEADCPADGEVGAVAFLAGRYYMMYGTGGTMIMLTLVADRPEGPFLRAPRNSTLLSGHTYFTRFFDSPDGMLISHHCIARDGQVYAAPFTRAVVDDEGTLRICWWPGNEKLKRSLVPFAVSDNGAFPIAMLKGPFDAEGGVVLEGRIVLPEVGSKSLTALYIACAHNEAVAIALSVDGSMEIGPIRADGTDFRPDKKVDREVEFRSPAPFRLLLEHSLLQFYLDDILMAGYSLPACATGWIGLIGEVTVERAWHCSRRQPDR